MSKILYTIIALVAILGTASASIPMSIGTKIGMTVDMPEGKMVLMASNNGYVIDATFVAGADIHRPGVAKALARLMTDINSMAYNLAKEQNISTDIIYDGNTPVEVRMYVESTRTFTYNTNNAFNGTYNEKIESIQKVIDASA